VTPQICHGMFQYDRCSTNSACRCLHIVGAAAGTGICVMDQFIFAGLAPCLLPNNWCLDQTAICINHPLYNDFPVCLPKAETDPRICPSIPGKRSARDLGEHCRHTRTIQKKLSFIAQKVVKISIIIVSRCFFYIMMKGNVALQLGEVQKGTFSKDRFLVKSNLSLIPANFHSQLTQL
jgi:hypothetical protein